MLVMLRLVILLVCLSSYCNYDYTNRMYSAFAASCEARPVTTSAVACSIILAMFWMSIGTRVYTRTAEAQKEDIKESVCRIYEIGVGCAGAAVGWGARVWWSRDVRSMEEVVAAAMRIDNKLLCMVRGQKEQCTQTVGLSEQADDEIQTAILQNPKLVLEAMEDTDLRLKLTQLCEGDTKRTRYLNELEKHVVNWRKQLDESKRRDERWRRHSLESAGCGLGLPVRVAATQTEASHDSDTLASKDESG